MEIKNLEEGEVFPELPKTLTCLTIDSCPHMQTLPLTLPPVCILTLKDLDLQSLDHIPSSVHILHLINCRIELIKTLPLTLETLHVQNTTVHSLSILNPQSISVKNLIVNHSSSHFLFFTQSPYLTSLQIHNMNLKTKNQYCLSKNGNLTNLQLESTDIDSLCITDIAPNLKTLLLLNTPCTKLEGFPLTLEQCICRGTGLRKEDIHVPTCIQLKQFVVE